MIMRFKLLFFLICLFLSIGLGRAQTITVSGEVSDAEGPLPGASVVVKDSDEESVRGTVTDMNGQYSLEVDVDGVLVFSFVGFESLEVPVDNRREINVTLSEEESILDEVVVVGYGTQKKASVVGSIAQTSGDDLLKSTSSGALSQSLQGEMPGVTSISVSGKPGQQSADLQIRGVSTWANS